jgi:hypothetical protein
METNLQQDIADPEAGDQTPEDVGMKSAWTEIWVAASGLAMPSTAPWPKRSCVREIFFSVAYATNEVIVGPVPGIVG